MQSPSKEISSINLALRLHASSLSRKVQEPLSQRVVTMAWDAFRLLSHIKKRKKHLGYSRVIESLNYFSPDSIMKLRELKIERVYLKPSNIKKLVKENGYWLVLKTRFGYGTSIIDYEHVWT